FVSLDPPRSGLGAEAAAKLATLGAAEIVYLSCDPSTLARDLAVLTGSKKTGDAAPASTRYEIADMHLFDLFPQTYHIETLVRLRRAPSNFRPRGLRCPLPALSLLPWGRP